MSGVLNFDYILQKQEQDAEIGRQDSLESKLNSDSQIESLKEASPISLFVHITLPDTKSDGQIVSIQSRSMGRFLPKSYCYVGQLRTQLTHADGSQVFL